MNDDNEMAEVAYALRRVRGGDRRAKKARRSVEREALLDEEDLVEARHQAAKRLRRIERRQRQAFDDIGAAAIYALLD